jgi:cell division protein FtsB
MNHGLPQWIVRIITGGLILASIAMAQDAAKQTIKNEADVAALQAQAAAQQAQYDRLQKSDERIEGKVDALLLELGVRYRPPNRQWQDAH